jgi:hypothetical protein
MVSKIQVFFLMKGFCYVLNVQVSTIVDKKKRVLFTMCMGMKGSVYDSVAFKSSK